MDTKHLDAELVESAGVFPPMLQEITRDNLQAIRDGFDAPGVQDDAAGLLKTTALTIPGKGHDVPIRVYQREGLSANSPAILWMHGGGYIMGSADALLYPSITASRQNIRFRQVRKTATMHCFGYTRTLASFR